MSIGCFIHVIFFASQNILRRLFTQNIRISTPCVLGNFVFVCRRWIFFFFIPKLTFSKISFRNTIRMSNSLDPDPARRFVGPDLDPNCLQRLSADDKSPTSVERVKSPESSHKTTESATKTRTTAPVWPAIKSTWN